jgi:hypothetical protein
MQGRTKQVLRQGSTIYAARRLADRAETDQRAHLLLLASRARCGSAPCLREQKLTVCPPARVDSTPGAGRRRRVFPRALAAVIRAAQSIVVVVGAQQQQQQQPDSQAAAARAPHPLIM